VTMLSSRGESPGGWAGLFVGFVVQINTKKDCTRLFAVITVQQ
jgi:hypothetical protein